MKIYSGLIAAMLLGCSGSVETTADSGSSSGSSSSSGTGEPDPCATRTEPFDSNAALAQIHCAYPTYTQLELLRSSPGGDLDPLGRSSQWNFRVRDDASHLIVRGSVNASHGLLQEPADPSESFCGDSEIIALDSAIVIPDLIPRFAKHDPYVGGYTNYFLFQDAICPNSSGPGHADVQILRPQPPGAPPDTMPDYWHGHYASGSTFVKLCGPCKAVFDDDECAACFD